MHRTVGIMTPPATETPALRHPGDLISTTNTDEKLEPDYRAQETGLTRSFRAPSPPRIYIPPPGMDYRKDESGQKIDEPHSFAHFGDTENEDFLRKVTYNNYTPNFVVCNWRYEDRRCAQKISPFLYIAPYQAAKNREYLKREGITLLIGVRETKTARFINPTNLASELGIKFIPVDVSHHQELITQFPRTINAINDHLLEEFNKNQNSQNATQKHGKVLVFCESGNERSAGVMTAYLMTMYELDLTSAVQTIQGQRFCVTFDDSMKHWLKNYEAILVARRQVERANGHMRGTTPIGVEGSQQMPMNDGRRGQRKRSIVDVYDSDMDTEMEGTQDARMALEADRERFLERKNWVPFGDK
jgi:serine/threonine/tyrosine-interacting protein